MLSLSLDAGYVMMWGLKTADVRRAIYDKTGIDVHIEINNHNLVNTEGPLEYWKAVPVSSQYSGNDMWLAKMALHEYLIQNIKSRSSQTVMSQEDAREFLRNNPNKYKTIDRSWQTKFL